LSNQATLYANFDKNYTPVSQTAQGAGSTPACAGAGSIPSSRTARLWRSSPSGCGAIHRLRRQRPSAGRPRSSGYLLAEANGLTGNETFNAGQVLMVPSGVVMVD